MATTSELTDTSLNIANTTTINGIESSLSSSASKVATSSAIFTAINNSASSVSSYVDSAISGNINYIARGNISNGDLNNLVSCGTYNCDNCSNSPCTYAKVVVEGDAANSWIKQTATNILSPFDTFYRIKNVSEPWTEWLGPIRLKSSDFSHYSAEFNASPTTFSKLSSIVKWVPANSFFIASASLIWGYSRPVEVGIGNYNSDNVSDVYVRETIRDDQNHVRAIWCAWTPDVLPLCVWGRWSQANYNFYVFDVAIFSPTYWNT